MSAECDPAVPSSGCGSCSDYVCDTCGFELWLPLWRFEHSRVGLYDDARFPGRCIVVLEEHATALESLDPGALAALMGDSARVGEAIRQVVGADRVNYAVLGNTEPHIHVHVIPRIHEIDPVPSRPPWEHPSPCESLSPARRQTLMAELVRVLRDGDKRGAATGG